MNEETWNAVGAGVLRLSGGKRGIPLPPGRARQGAVPAGGGLAAQAALGFEVTAKGGKAHVEKEEDAGL